MKEFVFKDRYGKNLRGYMWENNNNEKIKGVVQIVHGMTEWAPRYDYFAKKLVDEGYVVFAHDHRGHGKSAEVLGYACDNHGFNTMVHNIKDFNDLIREKYPNEEIILFGHSMGSFLSQRYVQEYGETISKLVLSGSNGKPDKISKVGKFIAKVEMKLKGREHKSKLMDKLSFGNFNNKFKPVKTEYDWLCSVEEEVNKYIEDEYCGFVCSTSFYYDLIDGLWSIHKKENKDKLDRNIPIYILAGDKDPVGNFGNGILNLYNGYVEDGVKKVEYKLYKDSRHEILNEFNRDLVIEDILNWIKIN